MNFPSLPCPHRAVRKTCRGIIGAVLVWAWLGTLMQPSRAEGRESARRNRLRSAAPTAHASRDAAYPFHFALRSNMVAVVDSGTSQLLFAKNADKVAPIASITKLITAMVTLDAQLPLADMLVIGAEDVDSVKGSHSFLNVGTRLSREDMLHLALMSSENRAAACLSRYYPGGRPAFIAAMNRKAREVGMENTRFADSSGIATENVSTAFDLVKLVQAASRYPLIRQFSTDRKYEVRAGKRGSMRLMYVNTNRLVGREGWDIELQKTGYTSESGRCLVMAARLEGRDLIMVFLDSFGKLTRFADALRLRKQLAQQQKR